MQQIQTARAPGAIGPYSQAIAVNALVYTSGQIGADPATGALAAGVEAQAHQACKNVAAILAAAGASMDKVVKTTVFIRSMDDFAAVNAVYAQYFSEPFPARSCVEVARLPKDALVELEAVAVL